MLLNHIDDRDLKTLRSIADQLGGGMRIDDNERRYLSGLMHLILNRIERVELKEHEDG